MRKQEHFQQREIKSRKFNYIVFEIVKKKKNEVNNH